MNDKKQDNGAILWSYDLWWRNGARLAALVFLLNALALLWLLLFDAMPRETLAWFVDGALWVLAAGFGAMK